MKKIMTILVFLATVSSLAIQAQASCTTATMKTVAEARVNPKPTEKVTGTVPAGASLKVISTRVVDGASWYMVQWTEGNNTKAGWVLETALTCN